MDLEVFEVLGTVNGTIQDQGRFGWRRFGVPTGGAMDLHAAFWANQLLNNPADAPVVELLLQGARLRVLSEAWIAVTGAGSKSDATMWRARRAKGGDALEIAPARSGLWTYLAVEGGFDAPLVLGSASVYRRGGIGRPLSAGDILRRKSTSHLEVPHAVSSRLAPLAEQRDYDCPPVLRVWPGPQWELFEEKHRRTFFENPWAISSRSDRVGYRLSGATVRCKIAEIISEPVRVGSIQVPESGEPIITMRDGPTVGGYPKLGLLHAEDCSWLAQCRPGQKVNFQLLA